MGLAVVQYTTTTMGGVRTSERTMGACCLTSPLNEEDAAIGAEETSPSTNEKKCVVSDGNG